MIIYLAAIILFLIGLYCIAVKKNLIKIIMGIVIMEYAINLFLVSSGYRSGGSYPILEAGSQGKVYVDPLTQFMALTVILIGLATTIIMVAIALRIYNRYETFDVTKINRLKG
jgi:multisubunit Na+/H+ antiporter MnhC subunit